MRVTAGLYKGRTLNENKLPHVRPTADIVKQALFNRLAFVIEGARVLDLFSGTGALGIEAISRGAKEVVFIDKNPLSTKATKDNLTKLGIKAEVYTNSFDSAIKLLAKRGKKFDIIIADPPYKAGYYEDIISLVNEYDLLTEDGILVCEHEKNEEFAFQPLVLDDQKRYGIKMLTYLKKKQ